MFYAIAILALVITQSSSFAILPDNLTLSISDVTGDGASDHVVLTKRSLRAKGLKVYQFDGTSYTEISVPEVRTYRGYVQEDTNLQVTVSQGIGSDSCGIFIQ